MSASPARWSSLRPRLKVLALACVAVLLAMPAPVSAAPGVVAVSIGVGYDGTGHGTAAQCPITGAGGDNTANDLVVCTQDDIEYRWNYNLSAGTDPTVVTFSQTLPVGQTFDPTNVTVCAGTATTFSGTGSITEAGGQQTLTCELTFPAGISASGSIPILTRVRGGLANGTTTAPPLTVHQDGEADRVVVPPTVTIVSAPNVNLHKIVQYRATTTVDGVEGWILHASYALMQEGTPSGKGAEQLAGPITWTDDLGAMTPNTQVYYGTIDGVGSTSAANCQLDNAGTALFWVAINNPAPGVMTCTQPAPGDPIEISVAGADTSGNWSSPAYFINSFGNDRAVLAGSIYLFVPVSDIAPGPVGQTLVNQYRDFDPVSVTGQSNAGGGFELGGAPGDTCALAGGNDNCSAVHLVNNPATTPGGAGKAIHVIDAACWYGASTGPHPAHNPYGCPNAINGGFETVNGGYLTPGQRFLDWIDIAGPVGPGQPTFTNFTMCDKWNPAEQQIDPTRPLVMWRVTNTPADSSTYTVEYTTRDYAGEGSLGAAGCGTPGDAATDGPWYPNLASVPGGAAAVSGVRVIDPQGFAPNTRRNYFVPLINVATDAGRTVVDQVAGRWDQNVTAANPTGSTPLASQYYNVVAERVAVTKATEPAGIAAVSAGDTVEFRLTPRIFAAEGPSAAEDVVTVTDTVDRCMINPTPSAATAAAWVLTVTPGSAGPDGTPCTGDAGETGDTLVWTTPAPVAVNTPLPEITYTVIVHPASPDGRSMVNTAVVSAPGASLTPEFSRTATWTLTARAISQIAIVKAVDAPVVEITPDTIGWTVTLANQTDAATGRAEWIDVLPYPGDANGSAFAGQLRLTAVTANPTLTGLGFAVSYTDRDPASITADPADPSNTTGGATTWCTAADFATTGCPATLAEVTAIRVTIKDLPARTVGSFHLAAAPAGNIDGDRYVNRTGVGRAEKLTETVPVSNPSTVRVVASTVGDLVWWDFDADGDADPDEPGIAGVTVRFLDATGVEVATAITGDDGTYLTPAVHSGTYRVVVDASTLPAGAVAVTDLAGPADGDSETFTLGFDTDRTDVDFGYRPTPTIDTTAETLTTPAGPVTIDHITVSGTHGRAGTATWTRLGPADVSDCSAVDWDDPDLSTVTGQITVTGDGTYDTAHSAAGAAGCYTYAVTLTGGDYAAAAVSPAGLASETGRLDRSSAAATTQAVVAGTVRTGAATLGDALHDELFVSGTWDYTADATWTLLGPRPPVDGACVGIDWTAAPVVATGTVTVTGDGTYPTAAHTPTEAGCFTYVFALPGDARNPAIDLPAGVPAETVLVRPAAVPPAPDAPAVSSGGILAGLAFTGGSPLAVVVAGVLAFAAGLVLIGSARRARRPRHAG